MKLLALVCAALGVAAALGDHKSLREVAQDSQAQHSAETDAAQGSLVEAHAGKALADKAVQSDVGHGSPLLRSAAHDVAGLASAVADDLCSSGDNDNCLYFEYDNDTGIIQGEVSIDGITGWCNPYSNSILQLGNNKNYIGFVGVPHSNPDVCKHWTDYWPYPDGNDYRPWMAMIHGEIEENWRDCEGEEKSPWFYCVLDITFKLTPDPGAPGQVIKQSLNVAKSKTTWALGGPCDHYFGGGFLNPEQDYMWCGDEPAKVIITRLGPSNKVKMMQV
jgi:hypothetical protein